MTTHDKTRTAGRLARLGTVGHGFRISRIAGLLGFRRPELQGLGASFAGIGNVKIPTLKNEGSGTRKINATSPGSARRFLGGRSLSSDIKAGRSLVGRGFQPRHNKPARAAPSARGAFPASLRSLVLRSGSSAQGRSPTAARRSSIFAFLSQKTPKSAKNYSTHSAGRNDRKRLKTIRRGMRYSTH
jgi:hypothetical protein